MAGRLISRWSILAPVTPVIASYGLLHCKGSEKGGRGFAGQVARTLRPCGGRGRGSAVCQVPPRSKASAKKSAGVIGDVFVDVMATVGKLPVWDIDVEAKSISVLPGGSALNGARHLHALGVDVQFLGAIGADAFGKMLVTQVSEQGFPTKHLKIFQELPSSVCLVLTGPKDRAMVSCYSTTEALSTEDLEERFSALDGCSHLHIGGYFNMKGLQNSKFTALVKRCRENNMTISMNTQYDAAELWTGSNGHLHELLPLIDLLFVSEAEAVGMASALGGSSCTDQDAMQSFCKAFPGLITVVTQGAKGCEVVCAGKPALVVPTVALDQIVDATGAGDGFFAGFLSAWLAKPDRTAAALEAACVKGHAVARVCVGREGGCDRPVSIADLHAGGAQ